MEVDGPVPCEIVETSYQSQKEPSQGRDLKEILWNLKSY